MIIESNLYLLGGRDPIEGSAVALLEDHVEGGLLGVPAPGREVGRNPGPAASTNSVNKHLQHLDQGVNTQLSSMYNV